MMAATLQRARVKPGELREDEPMDRYTTWRVGGPAKRLYRPAGVGDLAAFLASLPAGEQVYWCGLGSNLLVRDGGIDGTVIVTQGGLDALTFDGRSVRAEAGVACARLARAAVRRSLGGVEFLAGIPGTVGGALTLNAGAFGGETWERVTEVETVDRSGSLRRRPPEDYAVGYRQVAGPEAEWFVAATWRLKADNAAAMRERMQSLLKRRNATQPVGRPTCGSVFRNPPGDHAARLIEAAGLKGERRGGAYVSSRHANFIVNEGRSAADIEALIRGVQQRVQAAHGVVLEPEVHIVGEEARS